MSALHCSDVHAVHLLQLAPGQPLWQVLMEPYSSMWRSWEARNSTASADADADAASAEARTAFLQSLAAEARARRTSRARSTAGASQEGHGQLVHPSAGGQIRGVQAPAAAGKETDRQRAEWDSKDMSQRLRGFQESEEGQRCD